MSAREQLVTRYNALKRARGQPPHVVPNLYSRTAKVALAGLGRVLKGSFEIEALFAEIREWFSSAKEEEIVLSTICDPESHTIVEESLLKLNHNERNNTILPGVRASHTIFTLCISTTTVFDNENNLVISQRIYWDQAAILTQVSAIPRSSALLSAANTSLSQFAQSLLDTIPTPIDSVYDVSPIHENNSSNIQVIEKPAITSPTVPVVVQQNITPETHKPVVEHVVEPIVESSATPVVNNTPVTQPMISAATENIQQQKQTKDGVAAYMENYKAHNSLPVTGEKISVKLYAPPGGRSTISLGGNYGDVDQPSKVRKVEQQQQQSSTKSHAMQDQNIQPETESTNPLTYEKGFKGPAPPVTGQRVSVRLHAPPGGKSHITF